MPTIWHVRSYNMLGNRSARCAKHATFVTKKEAGENGRRRRRQLHTTYIVYHYYIIGCYMSVAERNEHKHQTANIVYTYNSIGPRARQGHYFFLVCVVWIAWCVDGCVVCCVWCEKQIPVASGAVTRSHGIALQVLLITLQNELRTHTVHTHITTRKGRPTLILRNGHKIRTNMPKLWHRRRRIAQRSPHWACVAFVAIVVSHT